MNNMIEEGEEGEGIGNEKKEKKKNLKDKTVKSRSKKSNENEEESLKDDQKYKFFVDLRYEKDELEIISKLLKEVNNKEFGREILFKDLAVYAVTKLTSKDLEKIQESSLNDMERVQRLLKEHNEKNKTNLDLGTFLVKKLNI
jgi:hypothetical protein